MMRKLLGSLALAVAAVAGTAPAAQAAVIDFNGLAAGGVPGYSSSLGIYTHVNGPLHLAGYTFTPREPVPSQWLAGDLNATIFCRGLSEHCAKNGTDYLLTYHSLSIVRTDGAVFDLKSFDLGNYFDSDDASSPAHSVFQIQANRADGSSVSRTITLDAIANHESEIDFNQFVFDGFTGIKSLDIDLLTPREWTHIALDNLDVESAGAAVPEPASLGLMGLGIAGLAGARRRLRR